MFSEGQKLEAVKLFKKTRTYEEFVINLKMYSQEEIYFACEYYDKCKVFIKTFCDLRYLTDISILQWWVYSRNKSAIRKQRVA